MPSSSDLSSVFFAAGLPLAAWYPDDPDLADALLLCATELTTDEDIERLLEIMARLRDGIPVSGHPLDGIDLLNSLEAQVFGLAQRIDVDGGTLSREASLALMKSLATASYGVGLLTRFELENLDRSLARLSASRVPLSEYRSDLAYLGRAPGWASRRLAFYFEQPIARLAQIEPLAETFIPDRMRGSPMIYYSRLLNPLVVDAMALAGALAGLRAGGGAWVEASRAAGFQIVCMSYGYNHGMDIRDAKPDAVLDSMTELPELLESSLDEDVA